MKMIANIIYGSDFPEAQQLDLYLPDAPSFPVFVYFHGGGLENGDKSDTRIIATYLASHGIAMATANYRMYPHAAYPDFIVDAASAVAWVKTHIADYGQCKGIYVGGSSAGGYLSMMLCFDPTYLAVHGIMPTDMAGWVHDAGQPTAHFNVLRERGLDTRRVIIDESAPLWHIGTQERHSPMLFLVSDNDMKNRYEQTLLTLSTLKHFGHGEETATLRLMHGAHCAYDGAIDEHGESVFGRIIAEFIGK